MQQVNGESMFSTNKSLIRKKMPTGYRPWLMSSTLAVALLGPGAAYAEPSAAPVVRSPGALEEVIVTAERRDASAQDIPISISVLGNREIQAAGADNQTMLSAKIPSLSIYNQGGATYFLRGIGTSGSSVNVESSVANYIDGVYLYSTYTNYAPLFAVERVEVLKGPQGTLFGRNTTGGVIQMVTRDPLEGANAEFTATVGNYSTWGTTFYGSTLIEDNLGVSLAVDYKNQGDGYGWNSTRNTKTFWGDNFNIQGKVAYQPFAGTKLTGFLWYSDI
ncbi:MAG TPA: TonB-dependent receptor plug domain-containing protein, partial [Rhizomicrobium sp.]|nr:TonB-dependent receptor plug domain-containing protein [Rhizomicrobium sp.]